MRLSTPRISEIALAAAAVVLLAALILPWGSPPTAQAPAESAAVTSPAAAGAVTKPALAAPEALNSLFVVKRAAAPVASAPKTPSTAARKTQEVPWLKFVGTISGAEGKSYYFFKDTRSGRSISLSPGETVNGWSLVEIGDAKFILKNNEDLYTVNKR